MSSTRRHIAPACGVLLAICASACWRNAPPPPAPAPTVKAAPPPRRTPPPPDSVMQAMERFVEDMCSCSDSPCAQRVVDEMTRWSQDQAKASQEPPPPSEEDTKRATEMAERMGQCMQNAMATGPATP